MQLSNLVELDLNGVKLPEELQQHLTVRYIFLLLSLNQLTVIFCSAVLEHAGTEEANSGQHGTNLSPSLSG